MPSGSTCCCFNGVRTRDAIVDDAIFGTNQEESLHCDADRCSWLRFGAGVDLEYEELAPDEKGVFA